MLTSFRVDGDEPPLAVEVMPQPASTHSCPRKDCPSSAKVATLMLLLRVTGAASLSSAMSCSMAAPLGFQFW